MSRLSLPARRRSVLAGFAAAAIPLSAAEAQKGPELLVAGPPGSRIDRWANPLAASLGETLPGKAPLMRRNMGGLDGVTGANAFEARGAPDGSTALLVPGAATLSWLVGETRAKFDPARWLPLWAAIAPSVLVSRVRLAKGSTLRLAATGPAGPELPALLALDLLGIDVAIVPAAEADTALVNGSNLAAALQGAARDRMVPVLMLSSGSARPSPQRQPGLSGIPTAMDLIREDTPAPLLAAFQAASLATQLEAGLMLPALTPASSVANWRRACQQTLADPDLVAEATSQGSHMLPSPLAAAWFGQIAGDPAVLLSLRHWLAGRWNWHPA